MKKLYELHLKLNLNDKALGGDQTINIRGPIHVELDEETGLYNITSSLVKINQMGAGEISGTAEFIEEKQPLNFPIPSTAIITPEKIAPDHQVNFIDGDTVHIGGRPSDLFLKKFRQKLSSHIAGTESANDQQICEWLGLPKIKYGKITVVVTYHESDADYDSLAKFKRIFDNANRHNIIIETVVPTHISNTGSMIAAMGTPGHRQIYANASHKLMYHQIKKDEKSKIVYSHDKNKRRTLIDLYKNNSKLTEDQLDRLATTDRLQLNAFESVGWGLADKIINQR